MSRPLRSTPITGASPLLRAGPPANARDGTQRLTVSAARRAPSRAPHHRMRQRGVVARLPAFRAGAADQARAAYMPDTTWPVNGISARLIPETLYLSGFDAIYLFRHFNSGSLALAFLVPT